LRSPEVTLEAQDGVRPSMHTTATPGPPASGSDNGRGLASLPNCGAEPAVARGRCRAPGGRGEVSIQAVTWHQISDLQHGLRDPRLPVLVRRKPVARNWWSPAPPSVRGASGHEYHHAARSVGARSLGRRAGRVTKCSERPSAREYQEIRARASGSACLDAAGGAARLDDAERCGRRRGNGQRGVLGPRTRRVMSRTPRIVQPFSPVGAHVAAVAQQLPCCCPAVAERLPSSQPASCNAVATQSPRGCLAVARRLPRRCRAVAMRWPRNCHAVATLLPCCSHAVATLLSCH